MSTESTELPSELLAFLTTHRQTPFQLSFIPSSVSSTPLISSPHIGLPKPYLLAAFASARKSFWSLRDYAGWHSNPRTSHQLLDISTVLLLVGSEHATAVNTRRQIFLHNRQVDAIVRGELVLLESLLTSPLPKHTKSSLLWSHRRWVLETAWISSWSLTTFKKELEIVRKAGEEHPRNYYAWGYARWAVGYLLPADVEKEELVREQLVWCLKHCSDVSGWTFLGFLLETWVAAIGEEVAVSVIKEGAVFMRNVAPSHESFWSFFKGAVGSPEVLSGEARKDLISMVQDWVNEGPGPGEDAQREYELEQKTVRWIRRFGLKEKAAE